MPTPVNWNGTTFQQPTQGDPPPWGPSQSNLIVAIANNALSKAGGTFNLTNALSFGNNNGISALSFSSVDLNPAHSGVLRLGNTDKVVWRDSTNTQDLALSIDTNGVLLFNGVPITAGNPTSGQLIYVDNYVDTTRGFGVYSGATVVSGLPLITLHFNANGKRFTPDMVGMKCYASGFDITSGYPTIASYISPTQITLSANATSTQTLAAVRTFEFTQNDTVGINNAIAAAAAISGKIVWGIRTYVYDSQIELLGIMGSVGQGVNSTFIVPFTPHTQTGHCMTEMNLPVGFEFVNHNIAGPNINPKVAALLSSMTISNGVLTAPVSNGVTLINGQNIRIDGPRGTGTALRSTYYTVTSSSSSSVTANAITWDYRPGVASVNNAVIASSVLTLTATAAMQMESAERPFINTLTGSAAFLSGQRITLISGTLPGGTVIQAASPTFTTNAVTPSGANTIYAGTFVSGTMTGLVVNITGYVNVLNNGTFTVVSNDAVSITVNNGAGVVVTSGDAGALVVTALASAATTGTVAYLANGVYADQGAAHMDFCGVKLGRHPTQGATILNKNNIHDNVVQNFLGDTWTLFQPNYGTFWNNSGTNNGSYGLTCQSASPTTGRFTNPSAFHIGASNQLYGAMAGLSIINGAGISVTGAGNNVSGAGILLDGASGVHVSGFDFETQTPYPGMEVLFPGHGIEIKGGIGNVFMGGFNLLGNPSSVATQSFFKAWGGAADFVYKGVRHVGSTGYVQSTNEIDVDSSCVGYDIGSIGLTDATGASNTILGQGISDIVNLRTMRSNSSTRGLSLVRSTAATSGSNFQSPPLTFVGSEWNGTVSVDSAYTINVRPKTGTNPISRLTFEKSAGGGVSGYDFIGAAGGLPYATIAGAGLSIINSTAATAISNPASPKLSFLTKIYDGANSIDDEWNIQSIPATPGSNPLVTLKLSHTGSTGLGRVQIASTGLTLESVGDTTSSTTGSFVTPGGVFIGKTLTVGKGLPGIDNAAAGTILGDSIVSDKLLGSFTFNTYFDTVSTSWKATKAGGYGALLRNNGDGTFTFYTQTPTPAVAVGDTMSNVERMTLRTTTGSTSPSTGGVNIVGGLGVTGQVTVQEFAARAPSTVTGTTASLGATGYSVIFNTSGTCTVTMPDPTVYPGRILNFKNIAAFAINSAASNIVPITSATAGTAIIVATAGKWAKLQSDGTNWIIMAAN